VLFISQPALTKQINLLESQVNMSLFSRGRHGAVLTANGKRLLPEAEKVVRQTQLFMQHAERVSKGVEGHIAVGFGLSLLSGTTLYCRLSSRLPGSRDVLDGSAFIPAVRAIAK
jgi:DNA-binding transcriptional LysR family regulator